MFIADVHLGKLARLLRLLGFDTAYENGYTNAKLIELAQQQNRILLSRSASISKRKGFESFFIKDERPLEQLQQVLNHFNLRDKILPFSRCIVCNGKLQIVPKENIASDLPENTRKYFNEFWKCTHCKRIYWKGSHYHSMMAVVNRLNGSA